MNKTVLKFLFIAVFLISFLSSEATTFFSQATGLPFSNLANWNSVAGGGGTNPIAADLTNSIHTFVVRNAHTITIDQDISVAAISVGQGTSGVLTVGNSTTARNIVVTGALTINAGATMNVGAFNAVHTLTVGGNIANSGTFNMVNTAVTRVCNTTMNGTGFPQITGAGATCTFNNLTINGGAAGADITRAIVVTGNFLITNNTPVSTAFGSTITGSFTVNAGSSFTPSAGTMTFNGASTQSIDVNNATFFALSFTVGNKSITGNITAASTTTLAAGVTVTDAAGAHTFVNLTINNNAVLNFSGTVSFSGTLTTGYDYNAGNSTPMGTAAWTFSAGVTTALTGATAGRFNFANDLTINAGNLNIVNNTVFNSTTSSAFTLNGTANLIVGGLDKPAGVTNFPTNFGTYTFGISTIVYYNYAAAPQVITGGADITYGNIFLSGNNKTVSGSPLDINGILYINAITANLNGVDVDLAGTISNQGGTPTITNDQTFTLNADDAAQTLPANITYNFNNLVISQAAPTTTRTKTFGANLTINGDFNCTNSGGSSAILLVVDLQNFTIADGSPSGTFTLGTNVRLNVSGTGAEFQNSLDAFTNISFDATSGNESVVRFNNTANATNQTIPYQNTTGVFSYGNIEFNGGTNTKTAAGPLDINGNILRVGGNPDFNDGNFNHTIAGNWFLLSAYYSAPGAASTITFDGTAAQYIGSSVYTGAFQLRNIVVANTTDIVYINFNVGNTFTILGNLTINTGANLDAGTRAIAIAGNWLQLGTGIFTQTTGTTTFNGTTIDQTIDIATPGTSYFGNLTITKATGAAPQTLTANTNFTVSGTFTFTTNRAIFDATNRTITIGGNWAFNATTSFTSTGSTIIFNGSSAQAINNAATTPTFNNITFSGTGAKTFSNNNITVNGNIDITAATSVVWSGGTTITLNGNWINTGGTGSFTPATGTLLLNNAAQNLGSGTFYNVTCGGTAGSTKTLTGNITLNNGGTMLINANITLDVSGSNFSISVGGPWTNNGSFTAQNGTVTFTGNTATINTGTSTGNVAGKTFYNVVINKTSGQISNLSSATSDLVVTNNLTITAGELRVSTPNDVYVSGDLSNSDIFTFQSNNCVLNLLATSGSKTFNPGTSVSNVYRDVIVNATGATYSLGNNLTVTNGRSLTISGGTLDLNGKTLSMTGGGAITVITIGAGTLDVDAGASLQLADQNIITINNTSSVFRVVGSASTAATVTTNGVATAGYNINQSNGVFHAKYFVFSNLRTTGIVLSASATIDATNNISEGSFTSPATGCVQFLDVSGINLTSANSLDSCRNVVFNAGATNNVRCTTVPTDILRFVNASGGLAGEGNDNDGANYITWTNTGYGWDGGAGTTNWFDGNNWLPDGVPSASDFVNLDHSIVAGAYQVDIATAGALAGRINIDRQGGAAITLAMSGTGDLTVAGQVNIYSGTTLSMAAAANVINVSGAWFNAGTFTATAGTVNFNGTSGTNTITSGGAAFNNLTISGAGATYQLNAALTVNGNFTQSDGTFQMGNFDITSNGDWTISGGTFTPGLRTVTLAKTGASTQTITGGYFYNLTTNNTTAATTANKVLASAMTVLNALTIGNGGAGSTQIQAGSFSHFVNGNWTNNTVGGFSAGTSTINFAGTTGTQTIAGTQATTFNNVTMSGAAAKTLSVNNTAIDGNWQISSGSGNVTIATGVTITNAGGSSTFSIPGATTLIVNGVFPTTFETVTLSSTSIVQYNLDGAQSIYNTTYGTLILRPFANNSTNATTKTAAGNINVATALNIGNAGSTETGVTLNMNNFNLTLSGITLGQLTGAPQITWGTGTMIQDGAAWAIDADITGFNNLTLGGTGAKTMNANLALSGDLLIQNGATLTMGTRTLTGAAGKQMSIQSGGALTCALTASVAFPTGFGTVTLDPASTVTLNGATDQTIGCTVSAVNITYGNLNLSPSAASIATINNTLRVAGSFSQTNANSTLSDNTGLYNMNFSGANVDIRNYTQSSGTTITLNGGTQSIYDGVNGAALDLRNLTIAGTASTVKTIGSATGVANTVNITGTVVINASITLTSSRNINYSGTSWTNSGIFNHTANTFTFNGTATQTINPGSSNTYNVIVFSNTFSTPSVLFTTNGINVTGTTTLNANAIVDMGGNASGATLTHTFGGAVINNGYWTTTNAHLVFNGGGTTTIPVNDAVTPGTTFTARNVTIGVGTKNLAATTTWTIEDFTLSNGAAFNPGAAANTLNIRGNWINNGGTFTHNNNTVNFNGSSAVDPTINITAASSNFFAVTFSPSNAVSYTLQSATTNITGDMTIGVNATLNVNSTTLTLGRNAAAAKSYTVNGVLFVNENASLRFDNRGSAVAGTSQCTMTVTGAGAVLRVVGTSSAQVATVTAIQGATQASGFSTAIVVTSGAQIQAKYYTFEYLADAGLVVTSTAAALDATNNFSEGTWQYMNTTGTGAANRYYLNCDAPSPGTTIANVTFNWAGAVPVPANRFNVIRSGAATGSLDFVDVISGTLGSYLYESDDLSATTGKITWPPTILATWVGSISSNWGDGGNWSTAAVPNLNTDVTIPAVVSPNVSPVIDATSGAAICKNLTITTGRLDCNGGIPGIDLDVKNTVTIGSGGAGVLSVGNSNCEIQVGGGWTRGATAGTSFINGGGTVTFNAVSGSYTIVPQLTGNFAFHNVNFNGATSSYNITGGLTVNGTFTINNATFNPGATTININGDYTNNGGTFTANVSNASTVVLGKAGAQAISAATFYNLTVSGSGNKTMSGTSSINNNLIINTGATLTAPAASVLTIGSSNAGTATINGTGVFCDGGGSHFFNGTTWTAGTSSGTGSTGTLTFNRNAAQALAGGAFNNLTFTSAGNITVSAAVALTGSATVNLAFGGTTITLNNNVGITGNNTTGVFTLASGLLLSINGSSNCPSGFAAYAFDATSTTNYTQSFDQTVGGITYGNLTLNGANIKTLAGDITVLGNLTFGTSTLDVSSSNYTITVEGNFNNSNTGSLLSNGGTHAGEVVLTGGNTQTITLGSTGTKTFNKLTVNKTTATVAIMGGSFNPVVLNDFTIASGTFNLNGLTMTIGGSLLVTSVNGSVTAAGASTFLLNASSGTPSIQGSGAAFGIVTINAPGITYTASDNLTINGNFTLTAGTFNGNGKYIYLGSTAGRTINIGVSATYKVGALGTMAMGPTASVTVDGTIEIVGTSGNIATVTRNAAGSSYTFAVNGTIKAQYYLFEYMAATGIVINSSATIDATNNFSDGSFTNGPNNCKYLTVSNTQTMTINNVTFPVLPTGSPNNVVKASAGVLTFYNSTGTFSGATYESDDGSASTGAIRWTGPETLTWTGATSTDWYTATNWSSSLGGNGVPSATKNVIIATNVPNRQPTIDGSGGAAACKNLTINSTMVLTLATGAGVGDLQVNGDVSITGEIIASSNNDYIEVTGNWTKAVAGTVNLTFGTVTFNGNTAVTINNGTGTFNHLTVNNASANCLLGSNTTVNGDLTITAGTLDVSGTFYNLTVKGNWINSGTFNARTTSTAIVTLNSSTAGSVTLNPGSSSFNFLTITGGASTVYTLTTNNLSVARNCILTSGELNLNSLTFNMGDNAGTDVLTIAGTLNVNGNAFLRMGTGSSVAVSSGGIIKIVGTDASNVATVTKSSGGSTYGFAVNSGATIHAQYYLFEYMNTNGIVVNSGATINTTNDFRNGTFSNGASTGKFLALLNNFADYTVDGLVFNTGPAYAVSRTSGTGNITINDPTGPLASYLYEEDDGAAATGLVRWTFTNPQLTWTGAMSTDWQDPANWATTGPPGPPDNTTDVTITDVVNDPVLTAAAFTKNLTISAGASITMSTNALDVRGSFTNNSGSFTTTGTVTMSATTGTPTINAGGSSFFNLTVGGTAVYRSASSITVSNNFTISSGSTFQIANSAHALIIGNNWTSTGGTFTNGSGTVTFNRNSGATTITTGASGAGGATFNNLSVTQPVATVAKTITLTGNLTVAGTLSISGTTCTFSCGTGNTVNLTGTLTINTAATFAGSSSTINLTGNWLNSVGLPFSYGTSTVVLNSTTAAQSITRASSESFYNLTINNTSGTAPQVTIARPTTVFGTLTMTSGRVATTATNILTMANGSSTTIGSSSSYIDGPMIYNVAASGATTINLPIGKGTSYRPATLAVTHTNATSVSYTAEVINSSAQALGYTLPGTISKVSTTRYWQIDRQSVANLTSATVRLYYGTDDGVTDFANLAVVKNVGVGTVWTDVGGTATANTTGNILSTSFASFSRFALGNKTGGTNPLPIELLSFDASKNGNRVDVSWTTASEINNDYFVVERSKDGLVFEFVSQVNGAGNSTSLSSYKAIDNSPIQGTSYYRLKQVDFNGSYKYSPLVSVDFYNNDLNFVIYPNPSSGSNISITFANNLSGFVTTNLVDVEGRLLFSKTIDLATTNIRDLQIGNKESLSSGVYFVIINANNSTYKQKLIVE